MHRKGALLSLGLAALSLLQMACATHPGATGSKKVRLLTGAPEGYYHSVGKVLKVALRARGIEVELKPSFGSKANIDRLTGSEAEFAIVQSDAVHRAFYGETPFTEQHPTLKLVAPLFTEKVQILTRPHLYLSSPAELKRKPIWLGAPDSGSELSAKAILMASGFIQEDIEKSRDNISRPVKRFDEAVELLQQGTIEALFQTTVAPNAPIRTALKQSDLRLLGLDWNMLEKLVADGVYIEASLQKTEYPLLTGGIFTVGVQAFLVTRDGVDDDVVKTVAETVQQDQKTIESALQSILAGKGADKGRIEPAKLTLLGTRPKPQLLPFFHPAARGSLPKWPIRKEDVHYLLMLFGVLGLIATLAFFLPRHRKATIDHVSHYLHPWLFVLGSLILLLIGGVWLRSVEGEINEHFTSLGAATFSLAETTIANKLPSAINPIAPPVPTTRTGQSTMLVFSWLVLLPLMVFAPLLRKKWKESWGPRLAKWGED